MVEKVTAGATGALGKIEMTGYDSADLTGMMEKVTAGATGALMEKVTGTGWVTYGYTSDGEGHSMTLHWVTSHGRGMDWCLESNLLGCYWCLVGNISSYGRLFL